jgi:hypothetical protein
VKFEISPEDHAKVHKWLMEEVYPPLIEKQRQAYPVAPAYMVDCWNDGFPYEGAIGGGTTYEFTPNSIGCTFKVRAYDQVLDLTDYDSW